MAWRWTSTPLSADRGEISVLAIVETIAAISISMGIAWYYETVTHIAVSACLAPVLLLRTGRSVALGLCSLERGLELAKHLREAVERHGYFAQVAFVPVITFAGLALLSVVCRIVPIILVVARRPLYCIKQIPINWRRVVFCMDSSLPPEAIPGAARRLPGLTALHLFDSFFRSTLDAEYMGYDQTLRNRSCLKRASLFERLKHDCIGGTP